MLLSDLWIRGVPSKLNGIKPQMMQEMGKALFDRRKSLVLGKVFAKMGFPLKPNVLHGILIGSIRRKRQTNQWPVLLVETIVDLRQ